MPDRGQGEVYHLGLCGPPREGGERTGRILGAHGGAAAPSSVLLISEPGELELLNLLPPERHKRGREGIWGENIRSNRKHLRSASSIVKCLGYLHLKKQPPQVRPLARAWFLTALKCNSYFLLQFFFLSFPEGSIMKAWKQTNIIHRVSF